MSYEKHFEALAGKLILKVRANKDEIIFYTDQGVYRYTAEGDCCSHSWFEHISGVQALIGQFVRKVEEISMAEIPNEDADDWRYVQAYGYRFTTDKGYFEIEMRNESNGYYGGYVQRSFSDKSDTDTLIPELLEDF